MKVSVSLNPCTPEYTAQRMQEMKTAGFEAIDFQLCNFFTYGQIHNQHIRSEFFDQSIEELQAYFAPHKQAAKENGIAFGQTHAIFPAYVYGAGDEYNEYLVEVVKKNIAVTAFLGCPCMVLHPWTLVERGDGKTKQLEYEVNMKLYTALIPTAKQYGVKVLLENMFERDVQQRKCYDGSCENPEEAVRYIDELNALAGEEVFGFCLDSGHAVLCGLNLYDVVTTLGSRIKALHLHDVLGVLDDHMAPFTGISRWDWLVKALKETEYAGSINFETSSYNASCGYTVPDEVRAIILRYIADIGHYFVNQIR